MRTARRRLFLDPIFDIKESAIQGDFILALAWLEGSHVLRSGIDILRRMRSTRKKEIR
jgi:hypothetical protein